MDLAQIEEDFGANISKLVRGVIEMDNIRQLNITHSASSLQVDNVRRMLLAMVDDFRCVIIKLAERIAFLRDAEKITRKKNASSPLKNVPIFTPRLPTA